jgi:hypothetical protein
MKIVRVMLCGAMLAAAAAVLPAVTPQPAAAFPSAGVAPGAATEVAKAPVSQVAYKKYKKYKWKYNFRTHGPRYKARRAGFNFYYGGHWYSRPWWTVSIGGPVVRVGVPVVTVSGGSHVKWCNKRYRHYNPRTNLYLAKNGKRYVCVSPYR